ncbi:MAG TPA: sigma-54 factor interaction domain-containing protein [Candidatus Ozemobacteraceae bacterium]
MKQPTRLLALSPLPEPMVAAALAWKPEDVIELVGVPVIGSRLAEWAAEPPADEIYIFLKDIDPTPENRKHLKALARKISRLHWIGSNAYGNLSPELFNQLGVSHTIAADLITASWATFHPDPVYKPLVSAYQSRNHDLFSLLNYLTDRCLMQFGNTELMIEAFRAIRLLKGKSFGLTPLGPELRNALMQHHDADFPYLEGRSRAILHLKQEIALYGPTDLTPLLLGETGTGKEAAAFYLHDFSSRRGKPFVALNCAGLDEQFLRSELFGHRKGAFTGAQSDRKGLVEQAHGGTLFLDEITEMPLPIQADLLRFLQTRRYRPLGSDEEHTADIRIIAAGQPELEQRLRDGGFRKDLYFRIADIVIRTPALREVREDIGRVINHVVFQSYVRKQMKFDIPGELAYFDGIHPLLASYAWPGNFRELVQLINLRLKAGQDITPILENRIANPLPCGGYTPSPASSAALGTQPPAVEPSQTGDLQTAMTAFVRMLPDVISADEIDRAYARAARARWRGLSFKELASRLEIAENTLRKRL